MVTVTHKIFGRGQVIGREEKENGTYITVKFERTGEEKRFGIPKSFEDGLLVAEGDLKDEIDSAIDAKNEENKAVRKAMEEAVAEEHANQRGRIAHNRVANPTWNTIVTNADIAVKAAYEAYLIDNDYSQETPSGSDSTVPQYIRGVNDVLIEEHLTWSSLASEISRIIPVYDEGGAKYNIGKKSNRTVINALRRFEEFC